MTRLILLFSLLLLFVNTSTGQEARIVRVYADVTKGDSVEAATKLLLNELDKGYHLRYQVEPLTSFRNDGFAILTKAQAEKLKMGFPTGLRQYGPEGIYISGTPRSVKIIGNTGLALQEAMYIYLEQLGYRYLAPGEVWNVVPSLSSPYKRVELLIQPHFEFRTISNGHGFLNSERLKNDFESWYKANRMGGSFNIWLGHVYDWIVSAKAAEFKQHPEYFAQPVKKGELPVSPKFNVANKDLVKMVVDVVEQSVAQQVKNKTWPLFVSMEPSDGGGFCNTPECQAIGGPSDQVFYLANAVAKAIQKYPDAWVGSYAYNEHIVPTKYKLEPNVFVMVTNGFNRSKYSTNELLQLWSKKSTKVGVYEYLSVYEGHMDMPGRFHASQPAYLQKSIRDFYKNGARAYQGESTIGWVGRALGQYTLTKLLWNVNVNIDSLRHDFFQKGFEDAAAPMQKLYASWEKNALGIPTENDFAQWHEWINEAYRLSRSEPVKRRIEQVMIYLRYLVLYCEFNKNKTDANILAVLEYANRTKDIGAFATVPAMVSLANYGGFPKYAYYANTTGQPWMKNKAPVSAEEIRNSFATDARKFKRTEGILSYSKVNSNTYVPLSSITAMPKTPRPEAPHYFWGKTEYIIRIKKQSPDNYFEIRSGFSAAPEIDRNVSISFYTPGTAESGRPVAQFFQSKKLENEKFSLAGLRAGDYSVIVEDLSKVFVMQFSNTIDYSIVLPGLSQTITSNTFYFYVPREVKRFSVYKTNMKLLSPAGRVIETTYNTAESVVVEVKPGENGIWKIFDQTGHFMLTGVPPYFGRYPEKMLVPSNLK